jgi:hypothetical protein
MSRPCPEPEELLRLLDGEASENHAARLRSHLVACRRCAQELDAQRRLIGRLAAPVGDAAPGAAQALLRRLDRMAAASPRRSAPWWWAVGAAGLAAAAVALVVLPRGASGPGEFRARGAAVAWGSKIGVEIWALEKAPRKLVAGAPVPKGTPFVASYSNVDAAAGYLLAFGLDARGEVHWLYPGFDDPGTDPRSVRLEPLHVQQVLPDSVVLDDLPTGPLRIVCVITRSPLLVSSVESLAANQRTLDGLRARFPGARVDELLLRVEPPRAHDREPPP